MANLQWLDFRGGRKPKIGNWVIANHATLSYNRMTMWHGSDEMRINARLDEDHRRKLEYLMRVTGFRVSDIVKQAIDMLYAHEEQAKGRPGKLLMNSGFIGCGEGPVDLSVAYKDELKASMLAKHDHS